MKTITVKIPETLELKLQELSKARRISRSRLVRDILHRGVRGQSDRRSASALELMRDGLGIENSGKRDLGSNRLHLEGFGQ